MNTNKPSEQELLSEAESLCLILDSIAFTNRGKLDAATINTLQNAEILKCLKRVKSSTIPQPKAGEISLDILQRIANKWESFYFQNTPKITVSDVIKLAIEEWNTPQLKANRDSKSLDIVEPMPMVNTSVDKVSKSGEK